MSFYKCISVTKYLKANELTIKKCPKCKTVIELPSNITYAQTKEDAKEKHLLTLTEKSFNF